MLSQKTLIGTIAVLVFSISTPAWAVHYYVDPNGSDNANGLSWATAFATIQKGINSIDATIVEVNEGTYYGGVDFNGVSCTLTGTDPNDPLVVAATVIDANGDANAVAFHSSEDGNSLLTGFTITGGTYGVYCELAGPTITHNQIRDNNADGVSLISSGPAVNNNWIYGNADAGIRADNSGSANLCYNTIVGNLQYGIHNTGVQPTITSCIIWDSNDEMNACEADYSCISDCNDANGTANICGEANYPDFVDPINGDYHLACDSVCINKGNSAGCPGQTDVDGHPRVVGGLVDMGADEVARVHNIDKDKWYLSIQTAISDSADGNTLVAYPCTYEESLDFIGRAITVRSTDPNNWNVVDATVIDAGDTNGVTFHQSEDANSILSGFTVTNATTRGIHCVGSSPKIHRCVVEEGSAYPWL
ncbi:MAG: right-handed parallel beta-helix repeat-containing protein, partial [Planctomycetota bacterium]